MTCLLIALVGMGLNSYRKMSLENIPSVDIPYVTITTTWVGATPTDMEKNVAKHIEDAVSSLDGLKHIDTMCMENVSSTTLEFNLDVDVDVAAVDVREKVDKILDELPEAAERPVIEKINVNATAVVKLAIVGDATIEEKYDYADNTLADRFSTLKGVGRVDIIAGNEREVHIELDRDKMAEAGLTSADIIRVVSANINSMPTGRIRDKGQEISVKFDAEYPKVAEMADFEVVSRDGKRRKISDLGKVFMTTDEVRQMAWYNGEPCVVLSIVKKGEGNIVETVNLCREQVTKLNAAMPGGMRLVWVSDEGDSIEATVDSTLNDVISGIILCAIILLIFLANWRTTVIIAISMPLTIIISFFFMYFFKLTLNTITLMAIGLSIGILVSNSIVVLENVVKRMEDTPDPWEAARKGTDEVAVSVFASAGTNVVVMLPITLMTSMIGRIFIPFATTTLIVNLSSIFISFTLTPILCACFLRPGKRRDSIYTRAVSWWLGRINALGSTYAKSLRFCSRSRTICFAITIAVAALFYFTMGQSSKLGFNLIEDADRGRVLVKVEYPVNYDIHQTAARIRKVAERLQSMPDLINSVVTVGKVDSFGSGSQEAVYIGQIQLLFKDKTQRNWSLFDKMVEMRNLLSDETGCIISVSIQSDMGGVSTPIQLNISGEDLEVLDDIGRKVQNVVQATPGVASADSTAREGKPQYLITPKRSVMGDIGLDATTLGTLLRGNLEGVEAATFKSGDRSYDIRVKYAEIPGKDQVQRFVIPGANGEPVLLSAVANVTQQPIPVAVYRYDKARITQITGTLLPDGKLQFALDGIRKAVEEQQLLPPGYTMDTAGDDEMMGDAIADFAEAILLASFLTYLTLAAILESFWRPLLILLTLPYGLIGVIWALRYTGAGITIFVMLGALMLIGVVVNAAVLIVDRFGQLRAQNAQPHAAMIGGAADSFRAVLMVVIASAVGMFPMAVATGIGSELRAGIGAASFAGVLVAGILTMFALPLFYCLLTRKDKKSTPQPN